MRMIEEFRVANPSGHALILQKMSPELSYLDFGNTHLPRDFAGYRVKYTDRTAQLQEDGTFKITQTDDLYHRVEATSPPLDNIVMFGDY